ncbi:WecB/TagA/CpsF family glycosyltransferase [Marinobacterium jannaschii]|uniref:WecB/TagA/CpsF family glycosyltransferase n=1 Tax=Marinobacterium jannaschii TaxID=64970 RepID=UPI000687C5E0|nr:WecB/TagA/CpsF family glycosyltransferase [Marinobacterium jannaschii]
MLAEAASPRQSLIGIRYDVVDRKGLFSAIKYAAEHRQSRNILNVNIHAMNLAYRDAQLSEVLDKADMVFVDGTGVKLGCQLARMPVGDRMTPMDWLPELFEHCAEHQWPVFLLGDTEEMGRRFAAALKARVPDCPFAGYHHGFFSREGEENERVIEQINRSGARILLVGMSMPIQEKWIAENASRLNPSVRLATGAFHRVYSGDILRGPKWMTDNGLEWLYRLCVQPQTWRRYILGNPLFLWRVWRCHYRRILKLESD